MTSPSTRFFAHPKAINPTVLLPDRRENYIGGTPDLIVEILPPSNWLYDRREKMRVYQEAGVPEYWMVDPRAETVETQPELLAHHFTEAGLSAQAIAYWQRAGQRALERSANVEAIAHLMKGFALLKTLPDTPERAGQELSSNALWACRCWRAIKGFAAPDVEQTYARARALCQQVGDTQQILPVLFGRWGFYEVRGDLQTARELAEELLTLVQRQHDAALLLQGHRASHSTMPSSIAPMPSSTGRTLAWVAGSMPPRPSGCSAILARPCSGARRP
jgi:Putative restriction endonuclease